MPEIIKQAEAFVNKHFSSDFSSKFRYHNLHHTYETVTEVSKMADYLNVDEAVKEYLILAAFFHDTGIIVNYFNHENESCFIAENFLKGKLYPEVKIQSIKHLILSTHLKFEPLSVEEQIISDADLSYLGKTTFFEGAKLLREEWELVLGRYFNQIEWLQSNLNFFSQHKYKTQYANIFYLDQKRENERILQLELNQLTLIPKVKINVC